MVLFSEMCGADLQNFQQTFFADHASISSICLTASAVIRIFVESDQADRVDTGNITHVDLVQVASSRNRFSSTSAVTIRTSVQFHFFQLGDQFFGLRRLMPNFSTTIRRS